MCQLAFIETCMKHTGSFREYESTYMKDVYASSNSSFLSALQTFQVLHTCISINAQLTHESIIVL